MEMLSPELTKTRNSFQPGSRGCGAFVSGGFPIKIGSGGTCVFGSVSLSGGFYLGFKSSPDHEAA